MTPKVLLSLPLVGLSLALAGCGPEMAASEPMPEDEPSPTRPARDPDDDGVRVLVVAGDDDVFLAARAEATLAVRYLDGHGRPVAGTVRFGITDAAAAAGATLGASATTDARGEARVSLRAGDAASFRVTAEAEGASPAGWRVSVTGDSATPERPLSYVGSYALESELDLGGNLPGIVGGALRTLGDLTDGPNDPASYLIDLALDQLGSSVRSLVSGFRPGLDAGLNGLLTDAAPELITTLRQVGMDVTSVSRNFGVGSKLEVAEVLAPDSGVATGRFEMRHTLLSIVFKLRGERRELPMAMLDLGQPAARDIAGEVTADGLVIGEHPVELSYGRLLVFALNQVVIPALVPGATDVSGLVRHFVSCQAVSTWIVGHIGLGSESMWLSACDNAITAVGGVVEGELLLLDSSAARLRLRGLAKPEDKDGDRVIDTLSAGQWTGAFVVLSQESTLAGAPGNTFTGARMP